MDTAFIFSYRPGIVPFNVNYFQKKIIKKIYFNLEVSDIRNFSQVCRKWRGLSRVLLSDPDSQIASFSRLFFGAKKLQNWFLFSFGTHANRILQDLDHKKLKELFAFIEAKFFNGTTDEKKIAFCAIQLFVRSFIEWEHLDSSIMPLFVEIQELIACFPPNRTFFLKELSKHSTLFNIANSKEYEKFTLGGRSYFAHNKLQKLLSYFSDKEARKMCFEILSESYNQENFYNFLGNQTNKSFGLIVDYLVTIGGLEPEKKMPALTCFYLLEPFKIRPSHILYEYYVFIDYDVFCKTLIQLFSCIKTYRLRDLVVLFKSYQNDDGISNQKKQEICFNHIKKIKIYLNYQDRKLLQGVFYRDFRLPPSKHCFESMIHPLYCALLDEIPTHKIPVIAPKILNCFRHSSDKDFEESYKAIKWFMNVVQTPIFSSPEKKISLIALACRNGLQTFIFFARYPHLIDKFLSDVSITKHAEKKIEILKRLSRENQDTLLFATLALFNHLKTNRQIDKLVSILIKSSNETLPLVIRGAYEALSDTSDSEEVLSIAQLKVEENSHPIPLLYLEALNELDRLKFSEGFDGSPNYDHKRPDASKEFKTLRIYGNRPIAEVKTILGHKIRESKTGTKKTALQLFGKITGASISLVPETRYEYICKFMQSLGYISENFDEVYAQYLQNERADVFSVYGVVMQPSQNPIGEGEENLVPLELRIVETFEAAFQFTKDHNIFEDFFRFAFSSDAACIPARQRQMADWLIKKQSMIEYQIDSETSTPLISDVLNFHFEKWYDLFGKDVAEKKNVLVQFTQYLEEREILNQKYLPSIITEGSVIRKMSEEKYENARTIFKEDIEEFIDYLDSIYYWD